MAVTEVAPRIVIDGTAQAGRPLIESTCVPVELVVGHLAAGDSMATLRAECGVTEQGPRAGLGYAAQLLGDEVVRAIG